MVRIMNIEEQIIVLEHQRNTYGDIEVNDIPEKILNEKILTFKELKDLLNNNEAYGQVEVDIFLKDVRYFLNYTKKEL